MGGEPSFLKKAAFEKVDNFWLFECTDARNTGVSLDSVSKAKWSSQKVIFVHSYS
jgi:hypothetical protein